METSHHATVFRRESTKRELLDRPRLKSIINHLIMEFSSYKFTVYRCAAKLRALKKALHTTDIPYKLVLTILGRHRLDQADETISVRQNQLTPVIHDILYACDKMGHFAEQTAFDLEVTTGVLCNFFWDIFDPNRMASITLLEVKETFLLLCRLNSIEEMITEFFILAADHNKCISRHRLESILKIITKLLSYIGESGSYGPHNVPEIVEQCFSQSPGVIGINEYQFNCLWNTKSNKFMIYSNLLALVKRIRDTEHVVHNAVCASCLSPKIFGIRFKCYSCQDLSLCMKCFAVGYSSSKHSMSHRVYEVYGDDIPSKKWTHYFTKLCNILLGRGKQRKGTDDKDPMKKEEEENKENANMTSLEPELEDKSIQCAKTSDSLAESKTIDRGLLEKLSTIVATLFEQNEKLENRKKSLEQSKKNSESICDLLNDQQNILLAVIDQLKYVLENTQNRSLPVSSTPNRFGYRNVMAETASPLVNSIHGASINKSYLDANKSYCSISEMSTWFHDKRSKDRNTRPSLFRIGETSTVDTEMHNFRELLLKVKEIVDDSYSDNNDLAEATYHLETFLDSMIRNEELRRRSS